MISTIVVLLIVAGCAAFQFFKGTIARAFATIVIAVFACIVAFGFFEALAGLLIKRGESGSMLSLVPWAQAIVFLLLFVLVFAVLQTAMTQLTPKKIDMGYLPEQIGRPILGAILGLIVSGVLLTFLVLAPLPDTYPYPRFESRSIKVDNPAKAFPNVDGLVTGLFGVISNGSFSGQRSFATMHPDFLDQIFLNRLEGDVSLATSNTPAIDVPRDAAVWPATETVKTRLEELNSQGQLARSPGKLKSGSDLMIARVGIKRAALNAEQKVSAGNFTLSQLRLICKRRGYDGNQLTGKGQNVYPIGYLTSANQIETSYKITISGNDFGNSQTKYLDFIFAVPNGFVPALVEFKLNSVVQIPTKAILNDAAEALSAAGSDGSRQETTPGGDT
ncbi:MAG: hypothetical protein JW715_05780 [Sedimentisphaerales bacterium]|nr:hypothetical protein [Sedimentisphaerales bacterium]